MNITLTLNYILRIDRRLAIQYNTIQYQYSDTVFAIKWFNNEKDGEAFLFLSDFNACMSHIHYLFICSEARRMASRCWCITLRYSPWWRRGQQRNPVILLLYN